MSERATVTVEHNQSPDHPTLHSVKIKFSCPHLRIGGPSYFTERQREVIAGFIRTHDHYGNLDCTAELRRRYVEAR